MTLFKLFVIILTNISVGALDAPNASRWFQHIHESFLSTPNTIVHNGYPVHTFTIVTNDSYILTAHRISCGRHDDWYCNANHKKQPILLLPAYALSSYFFVMQPNMSIGYGLAERGYDVWLGNFRGQNFEDNLPFSSSLGKKKWKFSLDEIGAYDIPALIDLVRNATGYDKIIILGHSLGANAALCTFSDYPQYNERVKLFIGWALNLGIQPHSGKGASVSKIPFGPLMAYMFAWLSGFQKIVPSGFSARVLGVIFCGSAILEQGLCRSFYYKLGKDRGIKKAIMPETLNHMSSASWRIFLQSLQFTLSGRFAHYDYGRKMNMEMYGSVEPPLYNFTKITVPAILMHGPNDKTLSIKDPAFLKKHIPGLIENYWVRDFHFQHLSFVLADDIVRKVNQPVYEFLEKYAPHNTNQ